LLQAVVIITKLLLQVPFITLLVEHPSFTYSKYKLKDEILTAHYRRPLVLHHEDNYKTSRTILKVKSLHLILFRAKEFKHYSMKESKMKSVVAIVHN
jgi:hypothetical protein